MLDWEKLKVFYNVAESGSFTQAASRLSIDQSAISRHILSLEDRLGTALFARHARGVTLTEHGLLLLRTTRGIFSELAMAQAKIMENSHRPFKILKIATPVGFGTTWLTPRLHKFMSQYPELRLVLHVSDRPVDLEIHESDVSITTSLSKNEDIIYEELMSCPLHIYASRSYLLKYGIPLTLSDLDRHRLIVFSDTTMIPSDKINWLLSCGRAPNNPRMPALSINNLEGISRAIGAGSGIACLPPYMGRTTPNLVQILPEASVPIVHFYFSYARQLQGSQKIQNLRHFLREEVKQGQESHKAIP